MPIEFMQCPKCGSPLGVQPTARSATCAYCGSRLRVTRGASGHPLAVLSDIKDDTAILAKQTAIDHLRRQLPDLVEERGRLVNEEQEDLRRISHTLPAEGELSTGVLLILMGALCLFITRSGLSQSTWPTGASALCGIGLLGAIGVALVFFGLSLCLRGKTRDAEHQLPHEARPQVKDKYGPLIADHDDKIGSTQARIAELETDIDRLAREL